LITDQADHGDHSGSLIRLTRGPQSGGGRVFLTDQADPGATVNDCATSALPVSGKLHPAMISAENKLEFKLS